MRSTLDLSLGHPLFLRPYWEKHSLDNTVSFQAFDHMKYRDDRVTGVLGQQLALLHKLLGNANVDGKQFVVGQGATQLLNAAIYAKPAHDYVFVKPPYFFRFPDIIKLQGPAMVEEPRPDVLHLVTTPSNPMNKNKIVVGVHPDDLIMDLCYNWPTYVDVVTNHNRDIMIFSLAKTTGHAGSRIGWAWVSDIHVAAKMDEFIETTTGGVSVEAQVRATRIIQTQNWKIEENKNEGQSLLQDTVFEYGAAKLKDRWEQVLSLNHQKLKPLNNSGMFLWAEYEGGFSQFFLDYQIAAMSGPTCGGYENQLRLNLGCPQRDFDELVLRLKGASYG
jgi:L-tryptophan---pyruvate aminotransferase